MSKKYDYLMIGSGLFGASFAYEAFKKGKKCLVVEKRNHLGGNVHCENIEGINVHKYGPHIFHTDKKEIWEYINQFSDFNRFTCMPTANYKGEIYNLPFNMNTFNKMWGVTSPKEAIEIIERQKNKYKIINPKNLEEKALSMVGFDVYVKLIKGYTEKQWGRKAKDLPAFIIERLPVRFTYDNNYFNDRYQGIPISGYNSIIEKMLEGSDIELGKDYFSYKEVLDSSADKILYTGMIDEYYEYRYGSLEYRSLMFEEEILDIDNFQGNAMVNYTDDRTPFTRIIEHKHFEYGKQEKTVITREYPLEWKKGYEPYYPINDDKNNMLYRKYKKLADAEEKVFFGGRLAEYRYYNMDEVILKSIKLSRKVL